MFGVDSYGNQLIEDAKSAILNRDNINWEEDVRIAMSKVYRYFKPRLSNFHRSIKELNVIFDLECLLDDVFLPIDSEPIFNLDADLSLPVEVKNEGDIIKALKCIVHAERKRLNEEEDIHNATLSKKCINSSWNVEQYCNENDIKCRRFSCSTTLSPGRFHAFCIVKFKLPDGKIKNYLVDCTYRQFFTYKGSFLERCGLVGFQGCSMGRYMLMDESRMSTAEKLLRHGYIEMTPENIKNYFDGFILEGRNGKYYERLKKDFISIEDYYPEFTFEDYLNAIRERIVLPTKDTGLLIKKLKKPHTVFDYDLYSFTGNMSSFYFPKKVKILRYKKEC